jgi:hypothetical protein
MSGGHSWRGKRPGAEDRAGEINNRKQGAMDGKQ